MNWSNSWVSNHDAAEPQAQANVYADKPPTTTNPWDAKSQDDVLLEWDRLKKLVNSTKELELKFRKYVVDRAFPDKHEGMNNLDLGNGYTLKAGIKFNYKLAENDKVEKTLDVIAKIGNQGSFIADRLVSWTPNFLLTEYRKLQEEATNSDPMINEPAKAILKEIDGMLTIDDAAPSLEIKEPKVKK